MHILFLSDNFPPEVNAPASRTFEHCREWVKAGHQVTVITCAPNFPQGRVFSGYRNAVKQEESIEGIRVIRVWSYITANQGFAKRILDYLSFMVSAFLVSFVVKKVDVIVGTSPQFFTACAAFAVSRFKRVPWVFELRDLWPESIRAVGAMQDSRWLRYLQKLELFLYHKADQIVSVTHSFKAALINRGVVGEKITVITNGVDTSKFSPREKDAKLVDQYQLQEAFVVGYVGTHGMAHGLETLLEAAQQLQSRCENEMLSRKVIVILLGSGACKQALVETAQAMNLNNVVFIDSVPKEAVVRYWSLLDCAIIHLKKSELFKTVIPSKLFEAMAMGLPVLLGVAGEAADIVSREQVGLTFEPENSQQLVESVVQLVEDTALQEKFSSNSVQAAGNFRREALAQQMLAQVLMPLQGFSDRKEIL